MSGNELLDAALAARLWALCLAKWGPLWQCGDAPDDGQRYVLGPLTPAEVERGLRALRARTGRLPPNLAEVRDACLGAGEALDVTRLDDRQLVAAAERLGVATAGKTREALERDVAAKAAPPPAVLALGRE